VLTGFPWWELVPAGFGYNVGTLQFLITIAVAAFDIVVVWFGVWIPLHRSVAREDRPYLWRGVADYARAGREGAEAQARMRRLEGEREFFRQRVQEKEDLKHGR
jgi:hypothetical protein